MIDVIGIDDLFGDRPEFFRQTFHRRPVLRRAVLTDRARLLITANDVLSRLSSADGPAPRDVRLVNRGLSVPLEQYTTDGGSRIAGDRLIAQFRSGATVICNHAERYMPKVHRATRVGSAVGCDSEAVIFMTPRRSAGLSRHIDAVNIFVIQTEGTKDWRVWSRDDSLTDIEANLDAAELGEPLIEATLHPGDVLYLPPRTPHVASALDSLSVHLSMTLEPRWCEAVAPPRVRSEVES